MSTEVLQRTFQPFHTSLFAPHNHLAGARKLFKVPRRSAEYGIDTLRHSLDSCPRSRARRRAVPHGTMETGPCGPASTVSHGIDQAIIAYIQIDLAKDMRGLRKAIADRPVAPIPEPRAVSITGKPEINPVLVVKRTRFG